MTKKFFYTYIIFSKCTKNLLHFIIKLTGRKLVMSVYKEDIYG